MPGFERKKDAAKYEFLPIVFLLSVNYIILYNSSYKHFNMHYFTSAYKN